MYRSYIQICCQVLSVNQTGWLEKGISDNMGQKIRPPGHKCKILLGNHKCKILVGNHFLPSVWTLVFGGPAISLNLWSDKMGEP